MHIARLLYIFQNARRSTYELQLKTIDKHTIIINLVRDSSTQIEIL